jgi:hypothetical protein
VSQKRARLTTKERKSSKYSVRPPLNPFDLPADVDERLNEWAYYFRDRQRLERCKSIEHRFQATSDDFAKEGWGDTESAPQVRPERSYALLRAIQTHEAIQKLDRKYRWIITYGYCYPGLGNLPAFDLHGMPTSTTWRLGGCVFTRCSAGDVEN